MSSFQLTPSTDIAKRATCRCPILGFFFSLQICRVTISVRRNCTWSQSRTTGVVFSRHNAKGAWLPCLKASVVKAENVANWATIVTEHAVGEFSSYEPMRSHNFALEANSKSNWHPRITTLFPVKSATPCSPTTDVQCLARAFYKVAKCNIWADDKPIPW